MSENNFEIRSAETWIQTFVGVFPEQLVRGFRKRPPLSSVLVKLCSCCPCSEQRPPTELELERLPAEPPPPPKKNKENLKMDVLGVHGAFPQFGLGPLQHRLV